MRSFIVLYQGSLSRIAVLASRKKTVLVVEWLVDGYERNVRALNDVVSPIKPWKSSAGHLRQKPYGSVQIGVTKPAFTGVLELLTVNFERPCIVRS